MARLPEFTTTKDLRIGQDPGQEAWLYHFLTENNLEYSLNPGFVASPEQLRFMVALDEDQVYIPCPDVLFRQFYEGELTPELRSAYANAWRFMVTLLRDAAITKSVRRRVLRLCRYRFQLYLASRMILPSRLVKRLMSIALAQLAEQDPFREKKKQANAAMAAILADPECIALLESYPPVPEPSNISSLRWHLDYTELMRLLRLSTLRDVWTDKATVWDAMEDCSSPCPEGICLHNLLGPAELPRKKILFLPEIAGGFIADLVVIRSLLRQGHQVILALKEGFYFNAPVMWDIEADPVLQKAMDGVFILHNDTVTKNALLQYLRENRLVVISDGTSEQLNMYRTSVTFSRAWKECDVVMAKGLRNAHVLLGTSHEYTRDIICYWRDDNGAFNFQFRPKAPWVRKFTETDLMGHADAIINNMHTARAEGKSVMFYSAVIGSIPGQTKIAIQVVNRFVQHLRERMENTFIINPAEYFIEGMDGDDLMYMWERVQRSGYLDVWRFQTVDDIEVSFGLMGRKVPSVWLGKDSTFSTGCTKEMHIALDVQRVHPEMQLIGPAPEKFFRRREYGVGKYFDARIGA